MSSKYDPYWRSRLTELAAAVERAAGGDAAQLHVAGIRELGQRASWYGLAVVSRRRVVSAQMAHTTALGRLVTEFGLTDAWPDREFRFSISASCLLTVTSSKTHGDAKTEPPLSAETVSSFPPSASRTGITDPRPVDALSGCRRIHDLLDLLFDLNAPDQVDFENGLYFFFEEREHSIHGSGGRVVRVGNHPLAQERLVGRLEDHFKKSRNAKNGSVFRRYIGGSLLRRTDPEHPCLKPAPGRGHWEHQDDPECEICVPVEEEVTDYLASRMRFRAVRIDDKELRNTLEKRLIATLAGCTVCRPSSEWLGHYCYQEEVRVSGLWNQQHTTGPLMTKADIDRFESLVKTTAAERSSLLLSPRGDELSDTLLIVPCCSSKKGVAIPELPLIRVGDLLPADMSRTLDEGRRLAFERSGVTKDEKSPLEPALAVYTGQPYATPRFRELLLTALDRGMHCLIVSGGYGLVRPEEPISRYSAHLPTQTRSVWTRRLRSLIPSYVEQNRIRRVFVCVSGSYASCLPRGFAAEEWWGIPPFDRRLDEGSPMRVVPERVGQMVVNLLEALEPGDGWMQIA